jgi:hypothetical protein
VPVPANSAEEFAVASQLKRGRQPVAPIAIAASERRPGLEAVLGGSPCPDIAIAEDGFARGVAKLDQRPRNLGEQAGL